MANAFYRKLPNGQWINQANPGGPSVFQVQFNAEDSLWYPYFTYNGINWFIFVPVTGGFATSSAAQTALDTYVGQLNAGTA